MTTPILPPGFAALEPFARDWAGIDAADRARIRDEAQPDAAKAFHDAAEPLLKPGLALLDAKPLASLDEAEERLMRVLLTFAHVALATEIQREEERGHARLRAHLKIIRAPADVSAKVAVAASQAGR